MSGWIWAWIWAVAAQGVSPAKAPPPPEPPSYEVRWDAPKDCGTAKDVRAEVSRLGVESTAPRESSVGVEEILRVFGTVTRSDDERWRLTLVLEQRGRPRGRALEAPSCRALVQSAAFIIAIALDPSVGGLDAQPGPEPEPAPEPEPEPRPEPEPEPEPRPEPEPEPEPEPKPEPRKRALWAAIQAGGGMRVGASPIGGTAELALGVEGRRWRAELSGAYDPPREFEGADPSVAMRLQGGRGALRGCYVASLHRVAFPTCAVAEVGGLDAAGRRLETSLRRRRLWLAFGFRGGMEVRIVGPLALALTTEALIPMIQHEFTAGPAPEVLIHRIGPADVRVAGHVRLRFQ
ncbi:MAG: hypothetical protein AAGF11_49445 [Myxococcota bacterium]